MLGLGGAAEPEPEPEPEPEDERVDEAEPELEPVPVDEGAGTGRRAASGRHGRGLDPRNLAATLDALGDLDTDVARAVAAAVVEWLRALIAALLPPRVADEIAWPWRHRRRRVPRPGTRRATRTAGRTSHGVGGPAPP